MKKNYKILSIVLALVLVASIITSTFVFGSFAESLKGNSLNTAENFSAREYFGDGKKVVFVGDSFTQGCGSTGIVSYKIPFTDGREINVMGNGPEYESHYDGENYQVGTKLYSTDSKIWYEAIDGAGFAQLLKEDLENKFGGTVKNYGMSGITSGTLLGQTMSYANSELVEDKRTVTSTLFDTEADWIFGEITTDGQLTSSTHVIRTADFIELNNYEGDIVVESTDGTTKFKVAYFDDNGEFVSFGSGSWSTKLTLDKTLGSKALVKTMTQDISDYAKINIYTLSVQGNVRVIDGLTDGFDTVFLTIGGNDRGFKDIVDETTGEITTTAEEQFTHNLDWIVNHLLNQNKNVILMSMTPCADDDSMSMSMEVIDGLIEDVANDYNVPFVSCYNGMLDYCEETGTDINSLRRSDGLHPNDEGHKVVESIIWNTLNIDNDSIFVNSNQKVNFEVNCDKQGYEFTVYRVANLQTSVKPYEIRYTSLISDVEDEIFNGDSDALLTELDKIDSSVFTEVAGTYSTDVDGVSKVFEDLPAGIYYVRATNFPANVYAVQNSVFALPYYTAEDGWVNEIDPIPLATKIDESNPEIVKTITNSTKDNVNFTDVSLGDTVNFEIEASRVGSANVVESKDFKLKSYVVSDIMESGLTLNQDSFVVTLEDIDGNTLTTLENTTDYVVNIVANEGADTTFTVSLTPEYLAQDEFYSSANVVITYSAVLNKYSTREFDGNFNTATDLTFTNKTDVTSTIEGNTVYAYTFGIEVNKYDDAGTPLAGSEFGLYLTEEDAKAMQNAIATGTSTDTGKVEFFTESNDVIRLASGTYYIVETKATENYNRYTEVIPVTIKVEYSDTETNGTYILSAPANGIQLVEVKNSKVVIPNTGGDGAMYRYLIALAFAMLAVTLVVLKKKSTKKATATK